MKMDVEIHYQWTPIGRRPVGRPRKRWGGGFREAIERRRENMRTIGNEERYRWRNFMRHHN